MHIFGGRKKHPFFKATAFLVLCAFLLSQPATGLAQQLSPLNLPIPGSMVNLTPGFSPAIIKGITIHPQNPLEFDFIIDTGDEAFLDNELRDEADKLIKYFMASLTVPEEEMWVNLSPYEKDRIIPPAFGLTDMGRDLLAQDYMLKQLSASLMYPEKELGKEFWDRVKEKAQARFGKTDIPMDTFNKIWIVPQDAVVYEHEPSSTAFIVKSSLKVMLEEDYVALQKGIRENKAGMENLMDKKAANGVTSEVIREILLPEIEKEVNEGKTFSNLRQIYNAMILAAWYKNNLRESLLGQVYVDQNKIIGIDIEDKEAKQKIYDQYLAAFKKGVYDFVKEEYDPVNQQIIPRKYFSGGFSPRRADGKDLAMVVRESRKVLSGNISPNDLAMISGKQNGPLMKINFAAIEVSDVAMLNKFKGVMEKAGTVGLFVGAAALLSAVAIYAGQSLTSSAPGTNVVSPDKNMNDKPAVSQDGAMFAKWVDMARSQFPQDRRAVLKEIRDAKFSLSEQIDVLEVMSRARNTKLDYFISSDMVMMRQFENLLKSAIPNIDRDRIVKIVENIVKARDFDQRVIDAAKEILQSQLTNIDKAMSSDDIKFINDHISNNYRAPENFKRKAFQFPKEDMDWVVESIEKLYDPVTRESVGDFINSFSKRYEGLNLQNQELQLLIEGLAQWTMVEMLKLPESQRGDILIKVGRASDAGDATITPRAMRRTIDEVLAGSKEELPSQYLNALADQLSALHEIENGRRPTRSYEWLGIKTPTDRPALVTAGNLGEGDQYSADWGVEKPEYPQDFEDFDNAMLNPMDQQTKTEYAGAALESINNFTRIKKASLKIEFKQSWKSFNFQAGDQILLENYLANNSQGQLTAKTGLPGLIEAIETKRGGLKLENSELEDLMEGLIDWHIKVLDLEKSKVAILNLINAQLPLLITNEIGIKVALKKLFDLPNLNTEYKDFHFSRLVEEIATYNRFQGTSHITSNDIEKSREATQRAVALAEKFLNNDEGFKNLLESRNIDITQDNVKRGVVQVLVDYINDHEMTSEDDFSNEGFTLWQTVLDEYESSIMSNEGSAEENARVAQAREIVNDLWTSNSAIISYVREKGLSVENDATDERVKEIKVGLASALAIQLQGNDQLTNEDIQSDQAFGQKLIDFYTDLAMLGQFFNSLDTKAAREFIDENGRQTILNNALQRYYGNIGKSKEENEAFLQKLLQMSLIAYNLRTKNNDKKLSAAALDWLPILVEHRAKLLIGEKGLAGIYEKELKGQVDVSNDLDFRKLMEKPMLEHDRAQYFTNNNRRQLFQLRPEWKELRKYFQLEYAPLFGYQWVPKTVEEVKSKDKATLSRPEEVGGIDFNPTMLNLQIKRDGNGIPLPISQQPMQTMRIEGFLPIIINITPIQSLPMLLGVNPQNETPADVSFHPDLKARLIEKSG